MAKFSKALVWLVGIVGALAIILLLILPLADAPLRRHLEKRINDALSGYTLRLEELDLNPFDLGLILEGVVLIQDAHPEPPVARIEEISFSLHWRELLSLPLVGELEIERPRIHVNLEQLREEARDEEPVQTRGWREALERVYPLEINRLVLNRGHVTYIDENPDNPLIIDHIRIRADNIRNISNPRNPYPSPFEIEGLVFHEGYARLSGEADFMASPHLALRGDYRLEGVPLDYLKPILARSNIDLDTGMLDSAGSLVFTPDSRLLAAEHLRLEGLRFNYISTGADEAEEAESDDGTPFYFRIRELHATGQAGFVNDGAEPSYRLFVDEADLTMEDFSTEPRRDKATTVRLRGRFMGTGPAAAEATFRPGQQAGPDFTIDVRILDTRLRTMNNLLRAHAGLDVAEGNFSLFAEATVRDGRIDGYVKPFFADVDVLAMEQDADEGLFQMAYEGIVDFFAGLLENEPRELATRADLSGPVGDPEASTLQIIVNLVRNAFFDAVIPQLEQTGGQ